MVFLVGCLVGAFVVLSSELVVGRTVVGFAVVGFLLGFLLVLGVDGLAVEGFLVVDGLLVVVVVGVSPLSDGVEGGLSHSGCTIMMQFIIFLCGIFGTIKVISSYSWSC